MSEERLISITYSHEELTFMPPDEIEMHVIYRSKGVPQTRYSTDHLEVVPAASLSVWNSHPQHGYIIHYDKGCLIEPEQGWAITLDKKVVRESIVFGDLNRTPLPTSTPHNSECLVLKRILPVRYGYNNYFHFFDDLLGQLALLDNFGLLKNVSIVIPEELRTKEYFQGMLRASTFLRSLNWVSISSHQLVFAESAYFVKSHSLSKSTFLTIRDWMDSHIERVDPDQRVLLLRSPHIGRYIKNSDEVMNTALQYGFRLLNTDQMSFEEQRAVFTHTRYLIGTHGAALTNMMFRYGQPLSIMELFSYANTPYHFFWLSHILGFNYDAVIGDLENNGQFTLDIDAFSNGIEKLLATNE